MIGGWVTAALPGNWIGTYCIFGYQIVTLGEIEKTVTT
jgi:hypothetical protein